jgi:Signal transduction histidine kinase
MSLPILSVRLQFEHDVVAARRRAKEIAELLGFDGQQQTRLATAVSEIARNAFSYGGGGTVEFLIEGAAAPQALLIRIGDRGPGIPMLEQILNGTYHSRTGMGLGIVGAKRLMDGLTIDSSPGRGTVVSLRKFLPRQAPVVGPNTLPAIAAALASQKPKDLLEEFREQNRELLHTLEELRKKQDELIDLNRELEDTNRGVVALYAELDERADHLRRADELKTRFLSNMSHEFRTPLNSILALSRLLAERTTGDLNPEQEKQVFFIRKSAESLFELVNDLLDLAKVEAGKIVIRPSEFEVDSLFGALRGMLRPLLVGVSVSLIFEDTGGLPPVYSDEGKVSQILRNFISNSLKFTEAGEVRVSGAYDSATDTVAFSVADTGIGIAPQDRETIFEEFAQVDSRIQRKVRGTGLGLPLSRKLAELLRGAVHVESQVDMGSTFTLRIPRLYPVAAPAAEALPRGLARQPAAPELVKASPDLRIQRTVLVIDDAEISRYLLRKLFDGARVVFVEASSGLDGLHAAEVQHPDLIVLDLMMPGINGFEVLDRLKSNPATASIPVIVSSSKVLSPEERKRLGGQVLGLLPKENLSRESTSQRLRALLASAGLDNVFAPQPVSPEVVS